MQTAKADVVALARGFKRDQVKWPLVRAADVVRLRYGKALPERNRRPGTVPVYGTNGQCGWNDESLFKSPGVVLGRKGMGPLGVEWIDTDYWVIDTAYAVEPLRADFDLRFFYYLIGYVGLNHLKDGTSNPSLSRPVFGSQVLPWPPLDQQRAIAKALRSLDHKIELNRRMNRTLEETAGAIFKSWFLDFDPVRGTAPVPDDIRLLFPDRLVDSPIGPIPEGWSCVSLADVCTTQYGYTAAASSSPVGPKLLRVKDINKTDWIDWSGVPHCEIAEADKSKYALHPDDILVARMADPGKVALIVEGVDGVFASYLVRLRCGDSALTHFIFGFLRSQPYVDYTAGAATGSVQRSMNARVIVGARCAMPPQPVLDAFHEVVLPLRLRIAASARESATLTNLRDTLLPKLISGEVGVTR